MNLQSLQAQLMQEPAQAQKTMQEEEGVAQTLAMGVMN
jgi:hypothetical protein